MAENPLAIRASEDIKTLFNELAEQGQFENKGEFLNRLLTLYQSESMKKDVSIIKPAIETVETLMTRLLELLNGTAAAITTREEKHEQELIEQNKSFEETRALLQQRITSLEQERVVYEERIQAFIEEKEITEGKVNELIQQIKQLESSVNDKIALIDEYKSKNDNLIGIVAEHKTTAAENKNLINDVNTLKQENNSLHGQIDKLTEQLQQQANTFKTEQESLKKSMSIEKDIEILELKKEHQKELQDHQELYSEKVLSLMEWLKVNQVAKPKTSTQNRKKQQHVKEAISDTEE